LSELCGSDPAIVNANPHISISLLRFLLPVFIDAAQALGIAPERQAVWKHLLDNLAPLPLVSLPDGTTIFGGVLGSTKTKPGG
jgi:hypothetical protein